MQGTRSLQAGHAPPAGSHRPTLPCERSLFSPQDPSCRTAHEGRGRRGPAIALRTRCSSSRPVARPWHRSQTHGTGSPNPADPARPRCPGHPLAQAPLGSRRALIDVERVGGSTVPAVAPAAPHCWCAASFMSDRARRVGPVGCAGPRAARSPSPTRSRPARAGHAGPLGEPSP